MILKRLCVNRLIRIKKKNNEHVPEEYVAFMISLFAGLKQNGLFGDYSYKKIAEFINPFFIFKYAASTVCKNMKLFDKYSDYYTEIQEFIKTLKNKVKSTDNK